MTSPAQRDAPRRETPLEEGLRRYAPKPAEARRIAVSDFIISLLRLYSGSGGRPRI